MSGPDGKPGGAETPDSEPGPKVETCMDEKQEHLEPIKPEPLGSEDGEESRSPAALDRALGSDTDSEHSRDMPEDEVSSHKCDEIVYHNLFFVNSGCL